MKLTPTDLAAIATFVLAAIFAFCWDDVVLWSRWLRRMKLRAWNGLVGVWFTRRRMTGKFNRRRYTTIRIDNPDEHSPGIMVMRRDVSTGWWT